MESGFEEWYNNLNNEKDFIVSAEKMKETLKKGLPTKKDKDVFEDIFEFFKNKYEKNLPFDLKSLYIYMTKVKGWPDFDHNIYARLLTLIGLCGFSWKDKE